MDSIRGLKGEMKLQVGTRIFANKDGEILALLGAYESDHATPRPHAEGFVCIDLDFHSYDWSAEEIIGINMETMTPIFKKIPKPETEEQRRIRELEDALLLATDDQEGGIL